MNKEYTIEKITDIFAIPEDSFEDFLVDLKAYYKVSKSISSLIDSVAIINGVEVKVDLNKMIWIDDNKHNVELRIKTESK